MAGAKGLALHEADTWTVVDLPPLDSGEPWQAQALCAQTDPESFFPDLTSSRPAQKICRACPVQAECLEYALINNMRHGVWGGLGPRARDDLRRNRAV